MTRAVRDEAMSEKAALTPKHTHSVTSEAEELASRNRFLSAEFARSYRWLKQYLRRFVQSPADAEDVASSAYVELAVMPDLSNVREPRALLITVSRRLVFDLWRRRDLEAAYLKALSASDEAVAPSPESMLEIVQTLAQVDRSLRGLPTKGRQAFLYSQLDGMTYKEIGRMLGVSVSMVRKYIAQALEQCYLHN
jgi:RNA polymerase sigma-19 factor, ECF subfamily